MPSGHSDMSSIETKVIIPANIQEIISTTQTIEKMKNIPYTHKIVMSDPTYQWKWVSVGNRNVYIWQNAPVEVLGQTLAFGEVESRDEAIVPSLKGKRVVEGDGNQSGGDSDDTESGGSTDSQ